MEADKAHFCASLFTNRGQENPKTASGSVERFIEASFFGGLVIKAKYRSLKFLSGSKLFARSRNGTPESSRSSTGISQGTTAKFPESELDEGKLMAIIAPVALRPLDTTADDVLSNDEH